MARAAGDQQQQRILVCGNVNGRFKALFDRVNSINTKSPSPFDMLICTGNWFADSDSVENSNDWSDAMSGALKVPLTPIYVLGPQSNHEEEYYQMYGGADWQQGFEVLDGQITFLGDKGLLTTASGLVVAYLSSATAQAVEDLMASSSAVSGQSPGVDILVTSRWPKGVTTFSCSMSTPSEETVVSEPRNASDQISRVAKNLKPRYHLSSSGDAFFFERQPYRNHTVLSETPRPVTRFVSVAPVANTQKAKWIYAFSIVPASVLSKLAHTKQDLIKQPDDTTENPFRDLNTVALSSASNNHGKTGDGCDQGDVQFFYDMSRGGRGGRNNSNRGNASGGGGRRRPYPHDDQNQHHDQNQQQGGHDTEPRPPPRPQLDPADCWFCLASPQVEKHLVVSIGDHAYLAAAKGALTADHLLILPINHVRSTLDIESPELLQEIERFKDSLRDFFQHDQHDGGDNEKQRSDKEVVFFERNFRSAHLQIQVVPVPKALLLPLSDPKTIEAKEQGEEDTSKVLETLSRGSRLGDAVKEMLEEKGLEYKELAEGCTSVRDSLRPGTPYFFLELPSPARSILVLVKKGVFFPLQLGRELLASEAVLNVPQKIDWKGCALDRAEATAQVVDFRKRFAAFDFTLE